MRLDNFRDRDWFDYEDYYRRMAEAIPNHAKVAEIGNYFGASSLYFLDHCRKLGKEVDFYAIDSDKSEVRNAFKRNIAVNNFKVKFLDGDSYEIAKSFPKKFFDFVFVDGGHDYPQVRKDCYSYLELLKDNAVMGGHDYFFIKDVEIGVRDILPIFQTEVINTRTGKGAWSFLNNTDFYGTYSKNWSSQPEYFVYVPYVNNIKMLNNCLRSLPRLDNVLIINQSGESILEVIPQEVGAVFDCRNRRFTHAQNIAQQIARKLEVKYFFFCHSDVELEDKNGLEKMLEYASKNELAVLFTNYDAFCLYDREQLIRVGCWDNSFEWYVSDVDYYHRVKINSLKLDSLEIPLIHYGSSTLKSLDEESRLKTTESQNWAFSHYSHKWGGSQGQEKFSMPYHY